MAKTFSICGQAGANTGGIDCDITKGLPVQIIPGGASFPASEYITNTTFEAAFLSKLRRPSGSSDKLFPFPVIQGNTAKTTAAKYGSLGYGLEIKMLRSKAGYEFDVIAGSDLEKKLMKFDGMVMPIFIFDANSRVWGVVDSSGNFKGAKYLIGVEPKDFEDAQNPKTTKITISIIDSRDFVENARFADTSFNASDLVGLNDVTLYETVAHTTNIYKIGAKIATASLLSALNIYDDYATELADEALWTAKTGANFTTDLTITSVAADATNKGWTVTFDTTAYTALASDAKILLSLVGPDDLHDADITGIEAGSLLLTK